MANLAVKAPCCASLTRAAPRCVPFTATSRRSTVSVRAGPESNGVSASSSGVGSLALTKPIPGLAYPQDTETIRDVMAFAGPLPERVNGRLAMWAFASFALTEFSRHTPVLEQVSEGWLAAILFSLTISLASLTPKFVSGHSLKELHASATTANMSGDFWTQKLAAPFDTSIELWAGRAAMIGIVGLVAAELIKGDSFF